MDGSVVVTCDKNLEEEAEASLSHLVIYLEQIFDIVIWGAITHDYRASMFNFSYCSKKQSAVETTVNEAMSCTSSIDTNDSTNFLNNLVSKFGLKYHLDLEETWEISFDLTHQVNLQVGPDSGCILGDGNGDAATINNNCSAATLCTTKSFVLPPINYLTPPVPISPDCQLANQPVSQEGHQGDYKEGKQDDF